MNHLLIILGVGILLRLVYDLQLPMSIYFGHYFLDSLVLHDWALDILKGHSPGIAFFRAPLYPYIVAFLYRLYGDSPWPIIIFQNLCGLGTGMVIYHFAKRMLSERTALWAGLITIAYPTLIYFEGELMIESLSVLLFTLTAWLLYESILTMRMTAVIAAGLAFGLSSIARPTILPLAALLPIALFLRRKQASITGSLRLTLVFAVFLFLPIVPVTLTNIISGGEFVLISTQGGANFYIGNNKTADGLTAIAPGPNSRAGKYADNVWTSSVDEAERRVGHKLTQSQVSSYWFREGLKDVAADPIRAVRLFFKKFYLFYHGQEIFNNKALYYAGEYSIIMKILLWKYFLNFPSGVLIPLAIVGMLLAWRRESLATVPIAFVVLYSLVIASFFVCSRFRQPIMPLMILFGVYGVMKLLKPGKAGWAWIGLFLFLVVGLNLGGNVDSKANRSVLEGTMGKMYIDNGDSEKGIALLRSSIRLNPENMANYDMLGQAYLTTGQSDSAEAVYRVALRYYPEFPQFNFRMGEVMQAKHYSDSALIYFRITSKYSPEYPPVHERMGYIFTSEQRLDSAIVHYEKLLSLIGPNEQLKRRIENLRDQLRNSPKHQISQ